MFDRTLKIWLLSLSSKSDLKFKWLKIKQYKGYDTYLLLLIGNQSTRFAYVNQAIKTTFIRLHQQKEAVSQIIKKIVSVIYLK